MIDTLLYQCFVKSYLIDLVRLMLGLDQVILLKYSMIFKLFYDSNIIKTPGSGHLVSVKFYLKFLYF